MIGNKCIDMDFHAIFSDDELSHVQLLRDNSDSFSQLRLEDALSAWISMTIRMIAKQIDVDMKTIECKVVMDKSDQNTRMACILNLDNTICPQDRDFLLNIIGFCVRKKLGENIQWERCENR